MKYHPDETTVEVTTENAGKMTAFLTGSFMRMGPNTYVLTEKQMEDLERSGIPYTILNDDE